MFERCNCGFDVPHFYFVLPCGMECPIPVFSREAALNILNGLKRMPCIGPHAAILAMQAGQLDLPDELTALDIESILMAGAAMGL